MRLSSEVYHVDRVETYLSNFKNPKVDEIAGKLGHTADFFEFMEAVMQHQGAERMSTNPPNPGSDATPSGNMQTTSDSMKQVHADMLLNKDRYEKDPGYRDEISVRIQKLHPEEG